MLASTKTVMRKIGTTMPFFSTDVDDDETRRRTTLMLDLDVFHEMNDPEVITVTVTAGDTLNP